MSPIVEIYARATKRKGAHADTLILETVERSKSLRSNCWVFALQIRSYFYFLHLGESEDKTFKFSIIYRVSQKTHFQNALGATVHWLNHK